MLLLSSTNCDLGKLFCYAVLNEILRGVGVVISTLKVITKRPWVNWLSNHVLTASTWQVSTDRIFILIQSYIFFFLKIIALIKSRHVFINCWSQYEDQLLTFCYELYARSPNRNAVSSQGHYVDPGQPQNVQYPWTFLVRTCLCKLSTANLHMSGMLPFTCRSFLFNVTDVRKSVMVSIWIKVTHPGNCDWWGL